jgi:O-antigen/teichoic acid export membrane protein
VTENSDRYSPGLPSGTPRLPSASRAGALLALAAAGGLVFNYLFLVASGRLLGSGGYGDLAAILGLLTVVLLPAGALQMAVSRDVSRDLAVGDGARAQAFEHSILRFGLLATVPLLAGFAILLVPLERLLAIESTAALALAGATLTATFLSPAALGILQGQQRFVALATVTFVPFVVRLAVLGLVAVAGASVAGATGAVFASAMAGLGLALSQVPGALRRPAAVAPPLRPFLRYLAPVMVGLIGISVLVNADVIVVNARFPDGQAGVYAAAAAFARVGYFFPATILSVLFPRTAARQARGQETADILGRSLIVTAAFCVLLAGVYALVGDRLVGASFGTDFEGSGGLLPLFAMEIGLISIANVLVGFHLSRGETRFAWIVAAGVPIQLVALAVIPNTLREVIWVNIALGTALLTAHEIAMGSTLPAVRAGARRFLTRAA